MGRLMFVCPDTGRDFDTGFSSTPGELLEIAVDKSITLRCTICGRLHRFVVAHGRVEQDRASTRNQSTHQVPGAGTRIGEAGNQRKR